LPIGVAALGGISARVAATIYVLQLSAGQFTHDISPLNNQAYKTYALAISLSVIAMQGFAQDGQIRYPLVAGISNGNTSPSPFIQGTVTFL
jgi:hypothetical protein